MVNEPILVEKYSKMEVSCLKEASDFFQTRFENTFLKLSHTLRKIVRHKQDVRNILSVLIGQ